MATTDFNKAIAGLRTKLARQLEAVKATQEMIDALEVLQKTKK